MDLGQNLVGPQHQARKRIGHLESLFVFDFVNNFLGYYRNPLPHLGILIYVGDHHAILYQKLWIYQEIHLGFQEKGCHQMLRIYRE